MTKYPSHNARIICGRKSNGNRGDQHRAIEIMPQIWRVLRAEFGTRCMEVRQECDFQPNARFAERYTIKISMPLADQEMLDYSGVIKFTHDKIEREARKVSSVLRGAISGTVASYRATRHPIQNVWYIRFDFLVADKTTKKKPYIGQVSDKRAATIARELGPRSRYGNIDHYNIAILGAAHHLDAQGQPGATYGGQYGNGNTFWFLPGVDHAVTVEWAVATATLKAAEVA